MNRRHIILCSLIFLGACSSGDISIIKKQFPKIILESIGGLVELMFSFNK